MPTAVVLYSLYLFALRPVLRTARSYVRNFYGAPIWSRGFVLGSYLLTLESASIREKKEALERTRSLLGVDGLMHEDDSRLPSEEKKYDARCVRGCTRPDPPPRRRDKAPLSAREEVRLVETAENCGMDRRKLENYFFGLLSRAETSTVITSVILFILRARRHSFRST